MLIKQSYVGYLAIGGNEQKIVDIHTALFNWGVLNSELLDFGGDDFKYFLISQKDYIVGRAKAFAMNWNYNGYKGKPGGVWKLAMLKAQKELGEFKEEKFINDSSLVEENLS